MEALWIPLPDLIPFPSLKQLGPFSGGLITKKKKKEKYFYYIHIHP